MRMRRTSIRPPAKRNAVLPPALRAMKFPVRVRGLETPCRSMPRTFTIVLRRRDQEIPSDGFTTKDPARDSRTRSPNRGGNGHNKPQKAQKAGDRFCDFCAFCGENGSSPPARIRVTRTTRTARNSEEESVRRTPYSLLLSGEMKAVLGFLSNGFISCGSCFSWLTLHRSAKADEKAPSNFDH